MEGAVSSPLDRVDFEYVLLWNWAGGRFSNSTHNYYIDTYEKYAASAIAAGAIQALKPILPFPYQVIDIQNLNQSITQTFTYLAKQ